MKKLYRRCPICDSEKGNVLHKIERVLPKSFPIPGKYDVVSCENCGFTYADVDARQSDYNNYYATCNMYSDYSGIRDKLTEANNKARLEVFTKYISKNCRILDVGCGGGDFLKVLSDNGYNNLMGMDPSEESVQKIKSELGFDVVLGNLFQEAAKGLKGMFDVVCCTMVGEHIYDLQHFVQCLKQYVSPVGG